MGRATAGSRVPSGPVIAVIAARATIAIATILAASQWSSSTPNASALLIECKAIPGYSEPVFQRTMHRTKPRNARGTRYFADADPKWAAPNRIPVMIAAARIYENGGDLLAAADANRKLAILDRRFRTEYLTTVAKLEQRLGRRAQDIRIAPQLRRMIRVIAFWHVAQSS